MVIRPNVLRSFHQFSSAVAYFFSRYCISTCSLLSAYKFQLNGMAVLRNAPFSLHHLSAILCC